MATILAAIVQGCDGPPRPASGRRHIFRGTPCASRCGAADEKREGGAMRGRGTNRVRRRPGQARRAGRTTNVTNERNPI
ncbi:hypothetical protein DR62_06310 [Burkholderia thailandensis]|nr:hypothetical protein DR62_06310 [Burkholderia thailandensis]AOI52774.1 hypothetical protein WI24_13850 [Burkholderia thailandensis]AOJ44416.1 hypothetical protein WJ27_04425 [Burkholderia thailandensis]AOJ51769.1 hypothetical protein AQ475_13740 [Burkholderia thailandensis]KVG10252.1 hypothetical protein WJ25_00520 [Burkholderia thailandensis]